MKNQHRLISFILILSLIFSSLVFTASAADESSTSSSNDLTQTDFFEPTANYAAVTNANQVKSIKAGWTNQNNGLSAYYIYGDNDIASYVVTGTEEGNTNEYVMLIPTKSAITDGRDTSHEYIQTAISNANAEVTYGKKQYYVFDIDIATESNYLPLTFLVNTRYDTNGDGTTDPIHAVNTFNSTQCSAVMNITPGVFYHLTLVAVPDTNTLYVYLNDALVYTVENGVMNESHYTNTYKAGKPVYLSGMRFQISTLTSNMSVCVDNYSDRILTGDTTESNNDISEYAGTASLNGWKDNKISESGKGVALPSLIEVNGVKYNNTVYASNALDTYKLGNTASLLRSCYSGSITVNCDAVIETSITDVELEEGSDVTLTKGDGSTWIATLNGFKYSASIVSDLKNVENIAPYVRYDADDNLISTIASIRAVNAHVFTKAQYDVLTAEQKQYITPTTAADGTYELTEDTVKNNTDFINNGTKYFTMYSVDGNIAVTDGGNQYLIVRDNSGTTGDFPVNVHYQVNAYTTYTSNKDVFKLGGHDFIVFEQDIYSESEFINVYNGFMLRTPNSDVALSAKHVHADNISITPASWYHLTYVGEVATGNSYLFLNGECIAMVEDGLWDDVSLTRMAADLGIENFDVSNVDNETKETLINNMVLGSFRAMQIAGEDKSGKNLTPDMSAASDNYYLRWADSDEDMDALIKAINEDYADDNAITPEKHNLSAWGSKNIYNDYYIENILPERAVIATINGVEYYDTTSINDMLDDVDNPENAKDYAEYTTPIQEIVLYREYIGTINVNCRATVKLNGVTSNVVYGEDCTVDKGSDPVIVYKQTEADKKETTTTTENESSVLKYQEAIASVKDIYGQWSVNKTGNLYNSEANHTISSSNTVKTKVFSSYDNVNKTPVYTDDASYPIYDKGAQTHTLLVNTPINASINATASSVIETNEDYNYSGYMYGYTSTITTTVTVTENQYYLVVEFDIASLGNSDQNISIVNTVDGNEYTICNNLNEYLSTNTGEYVHVTIVGTVKATIGDIATTVSGATANSVTGSINGTPTTTYSTEYKIFINNVCKDELTASNSVTTTWENVIIKNSGNKISLNNVYVGTELVTNTYTTTAEQTGNQATGSSFGGTSASEAQSNAASSAAQLYTQNTTTNTITNTELGIDANNPDPNNDTSLDSWMSVSKGNTCDDTSSYGKDGNYEMPKTIAEAAPDFNTQTEETYPNGTYTTETIPAVYYPIASVDGVLYYADNAVDENGNAYTNNETALKALLESNNASELTVTFLREPTVSIKINSNAVVDYNGLTLNTVSIDSDSCITATGSSTTTVINLDTTEFIAVMNDVKYKDLASLQAAITSAEEVVIEFYQVPTTALVIACPASIDTNGLLTMEGVTADMLFTTDEVSYVITESTDVTATYDYTIIKKIRTATVEVRVVDNGATINTEKITGEFGTDIAELLTDNGLMNGSFFTSNEGIVTVYITEWAETPSGVVSKEDSNGVSAYVFTANVSSSQDVKAPYVCVDTSNTSSPITTTTDESTAAGWLKVSGNKTIILNSDLTISSNTGLAGSGTINVYLNGHTIFNTTSSDHGWSVGGETGDEEDSTKSITSCFNFYGDGSINYVTNAATHAMFFMNYTYTGKISFKGVTLNTTAIIAIIRGGNVELDDCIVNAYVKGAGSLFSLGEQYNGYSHHPLSLTLRDSDISFRLYNVTDKYSSFTTSKPMIYNKIVTNKNVRTGVTGGTDGDAVNDVERTIIIDGCNIVTQGTLVQADISKNNEDNVYLKSNMSLYVNNSEIVAKSFVTGSIKPNSIFFCDDVKTNIELMDNITFATDLIKAKTSDGIYNVLYTSHAYAPITWSNGEIEIWAIGSTPVNKNCLFDNVTTGGITENQGNTSYSPSGESFPFKLYMNLTLSSDIGFNIYVPTDAVSDISKVQVYMDGKLISPNTYTNSDTIRESLVAVAGKNCYDYTLKLAPQDAAKSFTLVIICDGKYVSRKVSVADYAEKLCKNGLTDRTKALLQVTLAYIEQATMFAGKTVDMSRISALRTSIGSMADQSIVAPTLPEGTADGASDFSTRDGGLGYIKSAQINVKEACAFRFNLTSSDVASKLTFYVATDDGTEYELRQHTVAADGSYVELSLNAYELARSIKIVYGGSAYDLYSLYDFYSGDNGVYALANPATAIGSTYEYKAVEKLIQKLYTYASVCDKYYDKNASEYNPSTTN